MITKGLAAPIGALNAQLDTQLQGVDEIAVLLDSSKADMNVLLQRLHAIRDNTARLESLFALIERLEAATEAVTKAGQAGLQRVAELEKGFDTRYPQGFAKLTQRLFGGKSGAAIDAPVVLPNFDITTVMYDQEADVASIRHVLTGGRDRGLSSLAGEGGGRAGASGGEAAEASEQTAPGEQVADSAAEQGQEGAGSAVPAEAPGEAAVAAPAVRAAAPLRASALARGEDDDDEEDDEDDD